MARLGRTELEVFNLGLGGIPIQKISPGEASDVIRASIAGGINLAETAEGYGDSEEKLSEFLAVDRERFVIATKSPRRTADGMAAAIDQSLKRLKVDYIDIYQIHNLMSEEAMRQVFGAGGAMEALRAAKAAGKIRHIGISGHRPSVLVKALRTDEFDTVQVPFNAVHREAEEELIPMAREMDIGIMAMKPICGGMLDTPSLGIRYCLMSSADIVLCGMKNVTEVEENLATVRGYKPLDDDEEEQLLGEGSQWGDQYCRRCDYCQPCPSNVRIPKILWLANYHRRYGAHDPWTEEEYAAMEITAADCAECGECEEVCPYELPIRDMLKEADRELAISGREKAKRRLKGAIKRVIPIRRDTH